ncbi:hypothetical protein ASA1KI_03140 [Opitutales bacterium ASA1]|nr:hypothetical protein ASA1KI_03140 [Opitutales bacterium ASA1]
MAKFHVARFGTGGGKRVARRFRTDVAERQPDPREATYSPYETAIGVTSVQVGVASGPALAAELGSGIVWTLSKLVRWTVAPSGALLGCSLSQKARD